MMCCIYIEQFYGNFTICFKTIMKLVVYYKYSLRHDKFAVGIDNNNKRVDF